MSVERHSHRRQNLLTGEWVLVSPHRTQRPWNGQLETVDDAPLPAHDAACHLCPGSARVGGEHNPDYRGPWGFDNDFPALSAHSEVVARESGLLRTRPESGRCRVLCYTERHDLSLARMPLDDAQRALAFLAAEWAALDAQYARGFVQVFENRGLMMGASNPHPHAQVWATDAVPELPQRELDAQRQHFAEHGRALLLDYAEAELTVGERVVWADERVLAVVPFWAVWPYETLIVPLRPASAFDALAAEDLRSVARALQQVLRTGEALFRAPLPYSLGFHARPGRALDSSGWQFHAHVYPPLLRSASVRKHLVGFEMLAMPQRDLTPEAAAAALRDSVSSSF